MAADCTDFLVTAGMTQGNPDGFPWLPGGPYSASNYTATAYVRVKFADADGVVLTVGNNSYTAGNNSAAIKSFDYDATTGGAAKIEIIDQEGGSFDQFFATLERCGGCNNTKLTVCIDWGWIYRDCNGNSVVWPLAGMLQNQSQVCITLFVRSISLDTSGGVFRYTCDCVCVMKNSEDIEGEWAEGDEDHGLYIIDALKDLYENHDPKIPFRQTPDVQLKNGGPKWNWLANSQCKLSCFHRWIEPFTNQDGRGFTISTDVVGDEDAQYGFAEMETGDEIDENGCPVSKGNLGTFIVNGGKCSSVLEFHPKIDWKVGELALSHVSGTGMGESPGGSGPLSENPPQGLCQATVALSTSRSRPANWDTTEGITKAIRANRMANYYRSGKPAVIEAEMKITGNPSLEYVNPTMMVGHTVSILYINPFYLKQNFSKNSSDCGEFLASGDSTINKLFTNENWWIKACHHSIRDGNYTTTLTIQLNGVPQVNTDANDDSCNNNLDMEGGLDDAEEECDDNAAENNQ